METILIRLIQLILSLSILVIIHEGGHFLFAKLSKTRVREFGLFFHFGTKPLLKFRPKGSETVYTLGWLPFGGFCDIAGMVDESEGDGPSCPPQPWEFRSKSAGWRLLIMIGGVMFNLIAAFIIYSMILFAWGDQYVDVSRVPLGMEFNASAKAVGFEDGDVLLAADGHPFERLNADLLTAVVDARQVTVLRRGSEASVYIPDGFMDRLMADSVTFASFRYPFVVDSLVVDGPAAVAGLLPGDSITQVGGVDMAYNDFDRLKAQLRASGGSHDLSLTYVRAGRVDTLTVCTDSLYNVGVYPVVETARLLPVIDIHYGFFASFPAGVSLGLHTLAGYVNQLKYIFSKEGAKQVGGFATIASIFPAQWDWYRFWYMTAFLSVILAVMNILPIPALDGGHVLFLLYEVIFRRKPSDKFLGQAQMVGLVLLLALLIWANFNDVIRFLF